MEKYIEKEKENHNYYHGACCPLRTARRSSLVVRRSSLVARRSSTRWLVDSLTLWLVSSFVLTFACTVKLYYVGIIAAGKGLVVDVVIGI